MISLGNGDVKKGTNMWFNEKNYIKKLQNGNEQALEYVYDKYIPIVKSIVVKVIGNFDDNGIVDECINDIFLSVWNNSSKFEGDESNFKNWVCAIAKFKSIDYYRKAVKKSEIVLDTIEIKDKNTLEEEILISENRSEVINLLNELEPLDRDIFIMKFFLGLKAEDIGLKLGLSKSAVDSRIYRNKKVLKKSAISLKLGVV